ncbi:MAG: chemotaxis protein CheC [Eubacterium sp.]|jgi:chemotaxis protein CheC|nr:chemotaxis protein CheC [Eubacterium sp.]
MLEKYEDLNEMQLDVLKEIGNIGSGNASTALSSMIGKEIEIRLPTVKILGFQEAIDNNGSPEDLIAAILIRLKGSIKGMILLLINKEFAEVILNIFFGKSNIDLLKLDESDISALSEIGNIMGSSYMSAIATLTGLEIGVEAPSFTADMLGAVMSVPVIEFGEVGDKLLCIDKEIMIDGVKLESNMMLIPTVESLSVLFGKLGVA